MTCETCKFFVSRLTPDFDGFCLDQEQGEQNNHYCVNYVKESKMDWFKIVSYILQFLAFLEEKEPPKNA